VATSTGITTADQRLEVEFDAALLPAGTYHYRIIAAQKQIATGPLTVVK